MEGGRRVIIVVGVVGGGVVSLIKSLWFGGEAGEVAMVIDIILFFLVWRC